MKVTVLSGLGFALLWIGFKMIFFWSGAFGNDIVPAVLLNMLFLLFSISIGLYLYKRQEKESGNALLDIKNAMSAGLPYAVIVSVFIYFYYGKIDPEFNRHQISEAYTTIEKKLENPEELKQIKASNEDFEVMTKEEILAKTKDNLERNYNPTFAMTISMLALLLLATLNSIFVTIIYRRIVFRRN